MPGETIDNRSKTNFTISTVVLRFCRRVLIKGLMQFRDKLVVASLGDIDLIVEIREDASAFKIYQPNTADIVLRISSIEKSELK